MIRIGRPPRAARRWTAFDAAAEYLFIALFTAAILLNLLP